MPFKSFFLLSALMLLANNVYCQVGIGTTTPSSAAMLEVSSSSDAGTTYRGLMPPRVPNNIALGQIPVSATDDGLMVFVQGTGCLQIYNGISWEIIHCTTPTISEFASDLFISEYVEGTSNNKAIEIANFTGSQKSLNDYKLAIYANGSVTSQSPISFNSDVVLNHGEVYIIKHSQAHASIIANQSIASLGFNGDDPVALRTSGGDIIDIVGKIGSLDKFGENKTLRKKPGTGPSIIYDSADYNVFPVDTFNGLGSHDY